MYSVGKQTGTYCSTVYIRYIFQFIFLYNMYIYVYIYKRQVIGVSLHCIHTHRQNCVQTQEQRREQGSVYNYSYYISTRVRSDGISLPGKELHFYYNILRLPFAKENLSYYYCFYNKFLTRALFFPTKTCAYETGRRFVINNV